MFDLGKLEKRANKTLQSLTETAKGFVDNTKSDIQLIADASAGCLAELDDVR